MLRTDPGAFHALALEWLSADYRGRLIIDSSWRIQWWNEVAERAVIASGLLHAQDCQLIVAPAVAGRLSAFLVKLKARAEGEILTLKDGDGHFLLLGRHDPAAALFCLEVSSSHSEKQALYADFPALYGLTESEGQAALALFRGRTVAEIAQDRKVSIDTVRTQVRRMYGKMGVQSREKFYKRMMPFRIA